MSASPQIFQGAGSTVGSTVCAPTRVKDAGNSNLGTFGVCASFPHFIAFFFSALHGGAIEFCDSIHVSDCALQVKSGLAQMLKVRMSCRFHSPFARP
jgi:hypothetical protein